MTVDALVSGVNMTTTECTVMLQVEESFMQQVVMHWQGSAAAAANTESMQSHQQAPTYGGPPDPSVSQVDRQGRQVGPQAVDATSLSSGDAETRDLPAAGNLQLQVLLLARAKQWVLPFSKPWSAFQQAMVCLAASHGLLSASNAMPCSR